MTIPSGPPQHGGSPAPQPEPRVNQMAVASVVTSAVGFILWPIVGGWITLIAASTALGLGFVATLPDWPHPGEGPLGRYHRNRPRRRVLRHPRDGDRVGHHQLHQRAPVNDLGRPGERVGANPPHSSQLEVAAIGHSPMAFRVVGRCHDGNAAIAPR
jgi:hypothetical protein